MSEIEQLDLPTQAEKGATLPTYATRLAAGADVRALLEESLTIPPGESAMIPTGLRFAIPEGYEIQVRPRSGLAAKHQIAVLNSPGTIDADYRGELFVILINHGKTPFLVEPKMRIGQLVLSSVIQANFVPALELSATHRGEGGFGHTGTH